MTDRDDPTRRPVAVPPRPGEDTTGRPGTHRGTSAPQQHNYAQPVRQQVEPVSRQVRDSIDGRGIHADAAGSVQIPQPANDPRFPPQQPTEVSRGSAAHETTSASPRRRWRWLKRIAITLCVLIGAIVIAIAGLQLRLNKGPINVPQLVGPIERGLSQEFGGTRVQIDGVALYRAEPSRRLEFRISNLRLMDENGETAVRVPTAAIDISRNALVFWNVAPKRIDLIKPRLVMSYNDADGLSLRFAGFETRGASTDLGTGIDNTNVEAADADVAHSNDKNRSRTAREDVSLVQVLQDTFRAARERTAATSFLKSVGVRDAVVVLRTSEGETTWTAPSLALELRHQSSRSVIRGNGTLTDGTAPWAFAFEIDDTPARGAFQVRTLFKDLVPGEFGRVFPALSELSALETPLSGQADFQLGQDGTVSTGRADIVLGAGFMSSGDSDGENRFLLDEGHLKMAYDGEQRLVRLEKIDLLTERGRIVLAGEFAPVTSPVDESWKFDLKGKLRFSGQEQQATPLSDVALAGVMDPNGGAVRFDRVNIAWPEGQVAGRGQYSRTGGISFAGQLGEMSKAGLLQAWPPFAARDSREWFEANIAVDQISGGQFSVSLPADFQNRVRSGGDIPAEAVSFDVSATGMAVTFIDGAPPLRLHTATASIRGRTLRVRAPRGEIRLPSKKSLQLSQSDLLVKDLRSERPSAQMFLKVNGAALAMTEFLEIKEVGYLKTGIVPQGLQGQVDGIVRLQFPMHQELTDEEVKLNGKIKLAGGAARNVFGNLDVAGAAVTFDLTEKAIEANGDILINGVPGKLRWLRLLNATEDKQPPLRISAKLDASDRKQVGLNINHFVSGVIATDIAIVPKTNGPPQITVQADLTQTDVSLDYLAWHKSVGQSAITQFDVVAKPNGNSELQNFKVVGDNIAIDGWLELGPDNRVRRFALPEFSIDVITRMEVAGELGRNNVWDVKVRAATFDARPVFRNLFSPKRFSQHVAPKESRRAGVIIRAFIKNMVGFSDSALNDVQIVFQRRDGKVVGLEANGALDSGAPLSVSLKRNAANRRILLGETTDAGAAFKLVGFYRNIRKGEAKMQVNLDDPGLADVSGVLWTRRFFMLGDPVVNEVLQSSAPRDDATPIEGIRTNRDDSGQRRTVIEFDQLRFNFSVGNGQFLLQKSYVNGPALGATFNGKVDFNRRRVNLGGTLVPLYGLNSALGSVPILGELLVGRQGEGFLGITFAIQGKLEKPDVLVNPVSLVAPGIFRQIFEISPQKQSITPRRNKAKKTGAAPKKPPVSSSWPAESRN